MKVSRIEQQNKSRRLAYEDGRCVTCYKINPRHPLTICDSCQAKRSDYCKKRVLRIKKQVIDYYGGECACCGETCIYFLSLDHLNDDGYKESSSGYHLYEKLIKEHFPPEFQVLCHNCNLGRYLNRGICPKHGNCK